MGFVDKKWSLSILEMQILCRSGLTYTKSEFDREKFIRITEIAAEIAAK